MAELFGNTDINTEHQGKNNAPVVGEIRQNQLITTFAIGSIVDFVNDTIILAGVDDWEEELDFEQRKIHNHNLSKLTGADYFIQPKTQDNTGLFSRLEKSRDIPAYKFPEILYCPKCKLLFHESEFSHITNNAKRNRCFNLTQKGYPCGTKLVASRFVVCCNNGHIEDFPYFWWVHHGEGCSSNTPNPRLRMYNVGKRNDVESLFIECTECGTKRKLTGAFSENALKELSCQNNHPHIEDKRIDGEEECDAILKIRLRNSSGIYFPIVISALSIPPWSLGNHEAVPTPTNEVDQSDQSDESQEGVAREDVCLDEYKVLSSGTLLNKGEYEAKEVSRPDLFSQYFEQVVAVTKLTIVQTLCGFTRETPFTGDDLSDKRVVRLSKEKKNWLPAVKLFGEGVFIKFNQNTIDKWLENELLVNRFDIMNEVLEDSSYSNRFKSSNRLEFITYVMMHTFSHLLIRQLSEVCGYNVASLHEKIYSGGNDKMAGVLIYLSSSDSEGSLGGLISVIENTSLFENIIKSALEKAMWCSADPLCSTGMTKNMAGLNYAACHDCTLLPETSCESNNILLDRVSVIGLPNQRKLGFFQ